MTNQITYGYQSHPCTIEDLCASVGNGWEQIIRDLCKDLFAIGWDGAVIQVKEKFGGLRFYIDSMTGPDRWNAIMARIVQAESDSFRTCETCGKNGTLREGGWWRVLCDECQTNVQQT